MYRSRLFTAVTFAGVLAFGAAAVTQCNGFATVDPPPPPTTTTTTTRATTTTTRATTTTTTTTVPAPPLPDPVQELISVAPNGSPASPPSGGPPGFWADLSNSPTMSSDGRYVAFQSDATNLVPGDTNAATDVFVRDRVTQTTQRIPAGAAGASRPKMSSNGRYVSFVTTASLLPSDANQTSDEYLFDRTTGAFDLISVSMAGTGSDGSNVGMGSVSDDGRYVAFQSNADDLVSNDVDLANTFTDSAGHVIVLYPPGQGPDVFLRDRVLGTTTLVSAAPDGSAGLGLSPSMTPDGRFVVFDGQTSAADGSAVNTVYVYSTATGALETENYDAWGNLARATAGSYSISADGNVVTFESTDAVTPDTPPLTDPQHPTSHLYVRNRAQQTTVLVDRYGGNSSVGSLSSDGRYVAYQGRPSSASSGTAGVLRTDLATGDVIEMDVNAAGIQANGTISEPTWVSITADGTQVAYSSFGSNLVPGDTNNSRDVFVATPLP